MSGEDVWLHYYWHSLSLRSDHVVGFNKDEIVFHLMDVCTSLNRKCFRPAGNDVILFGKMWVSYFINIARSGIFFRDLWKISVISKDILCSLSCVKAIFVIRPDITVRNVF